MSGEAVVEPKPAVRTSLFKRYENLMVLSIFAGFVLVIVLLLLIMGGGAKFPTFISPVNLLNILQQVGVPGIVAIGMTILMVSGGIDLSLRILSSLSSFITAMGMS